MLGLLKLITYDPLTGIFRWKNDNGPRARTGQKLSAIDPKGYRTVKFKGKTYKLHRVAWYITHNHLPLHGIDHFDRDKTNNAIGNLRDVTQAINAKNRRKNSDNTSGITGVSWKKANRKWVAKIRVAGKDYHLGLFKDLSAAAHARKNAEIKFNFHPTHGQ